MNTTHTPTVAGLEGNDYSIGAMDAFTQFHVARRIAPAMQALGMSVLELAAVGKETGNDAAMLAVSKPVIEVISKMSNEDVDFIIRACLSCCTRKPSGVEAGWAPIMSNGRLLFADIQMPTMMRLTIEVLKVRLGSFFGELLGGQS